MNIGILGGTFDPIHLGHLIIAEQARQSLGLQQVWFMPTFEPPHKQRGPAASVVQRLEMTRLAIKDHPQFRIEDIEIRRGGTSYTIETMTELHQQYPSHRFFYIIGGDMVAYLPQWHRIDELLKLVQFVGLRRPAYERAWSQLPAHIRSNVQMIDSPLVEISSTSIRNWVAEGRSVRYLIPDPVYRYVEEKQLYVRS